MNGTDPRPEPEEFEEAARVSVEEALRALHEPAFPYEVAFRESYDGLFSDVGDASPATDLLEEAQKRGRVIVHGEAGSGKTTMLVRLVAGAADVVSTFISLQRWSPPLFAEWSAAEGNPIARMSLLLRELAVPPVDEALLSAWSPDRPRIVVVDGLNEIPRDVAAGILDAVDSFARRNTGVGVIVADRLTRRELPSESWQIARLLPMRPETVAEVLPDVDVGDQLELLQRPFFLDRALNEGIHAASDAGVISDYVARAANLTTEEFNDASRAAYELYRANQARTFGYATLAEVATDEIAEKFEASGLLVRTGETAYFQHHLYHDFLAARWLAADSERWTREAFDAISFHASSFDGLAMVLEQVAEPEEADELILRIYDWNFYASAYALGKGRRRGSVAVTERAEVALLAMLAERRWDPLRATAEQVTDALHFVPSAFAQELLEKDSLAEIQELVAAVDGGDGYFQLWQELFLTPEFAEVGDDVVGLIADLNPLLGWTASNVVRRSRLRELQLEWIREMLQRADDWPTRWRAAHALGAHPSAENAAVLRGALADPDEWVRYGSIRALIEEASRDDQLRAEIIQTVLDEIDRIESDQRTIGELQRALVLREPPPGWADTVAPVIEELWGRATSVAAQDRWRRLAYDVERAEAA